VKTKKGEAKAAACPICGKPSVEEYKPFCSKRCSDVDLNRWLVGVYRFETDETPDEPGNDGKDED
jgi:uncharacterized protein